MRLEALETGPLELLAWQQRRASVALSNSAHGRKRGLLTGHRILIQLLKGEGDIVQFRQCHPDVLQHGPFLLLRGEVVMRKTQMPPCPGLPWDAMILTYEAGGPMGVLGVALHVTSWFIPPPALYPIGVRSQFFSALLCGPSKATPSII